MPYQSILAMTLVVSATLAAPSFPVHLARPLQARDGPDNCTPGDPNGQPYIADLGFYSDKDCNDQIGYTCVYSSATTEPWGHPGDYSCNPGLLPADTPFYARVRDAPLNEMQLVFTRDQSCPPNGPGAVFATLIDNASCVEFNLGGDAPGISVYPQGGSGLAKIAPPQAEPRDLQKRAPKCSAFVTESSAPSYSQTVQVSNIVDCTNGAESGCSITVGSEHTESVSTSFSVSAGGGIEGVFSVESTFGQEYTSSSTTSIQEGFSVQAGQKGYLSAYSAATLFKGKFTGCDSGDSEQPGQALVIKKEGFTYGVVNTGS